MWGMSTAVLGLFAAVLPALVIGLLVLASPRFAVAIFLVIGIVLLVGAGMLRIVQHESQHQHDHRTAQSPRSGGAPASGEGGAPAAR